ncbi:MAG: cohesin domain-containing protein [Dehalococcoidia bacterium]|nr:cohesin domain-containing protein [Dehalococcoidia bacterium]
MILDRKAAKIVLSTMAVCLTVLAVFLAITGKDITTSTATAQEPGIITPAVTSNPVSPIRTTPAPQKTTPAASPTPSPAEKPLDAPSPQLPSLDIYVSPSSQKASPGQEISVSVTAKAVNCGISGSEISVKFDPAVLQVAELNVDDALGSNTIIAVKETGNQSGILRCALARRGTTQISASEEILARIKFRIADWAKTGSYNLTLTEVKLTNEKDPPQTMTGVEIHNGSIEIVP